MTTDEPLRATDEPLSASHEPLTTTDEPLTNLRAFGDGQVNDVRFTSDTAMSSDGKSELTAGGGQGGGQALKAAAAPAIEWYMRLYFRMSAAPCKLANKLILWHPVDAVVRLEKLVRFPVGAAPEVRWWTTRLRRGGHNGCMQVLTTAPSPPTGTLVDESAPTRRDHPTGDLGPFTPRALRRLLGGRRTAQPLVARRGAHDGARPGGAHDGAQLVHRERV
jgi:hypothetical protein